MASPVVAETGTPPFVLGTVQLGLPYGVANTSGQPSRADAFAVLDAARAAGVVTLDTASAYGTAEAVIGAWTLEHNGSPWIVTKSPSLEEGGVGLASQAFTQSLSRLNCGRVAGLMLHRADDWSLEGVAAWLEAQRDAGRAEAIGVSVYAAGEIPDDPRIGIVQVPGNVFLQSIAHAPEIEGLVRRKARIFLRSVFAQGLLLMPPSRVPPHIADLAPIVARFQATASEAGVTPEALAIACARAIIPAAELVLGAENGAQVTRLAAAACVGVPDTAIGAAMALGRSVPPGLFDPRNWRKRLAARTAQVTA